MKKINWKIRLKNPMFWATILGTALMTALSYNSMKPSDLTTWQGLGELIVGVSKNPYLIGTIAISIVGIITDPTTKGFTDSTHALNKDELD